MSRLALFVVAVLMLALPAQNSVRAQSGATPWTEPHMLTPDPGQFRIRPLVTADRNGNLHAIWHEGEELGPNNWRIEAIYYSSWDGAEWSKPVDILAAPGGTGGNMDQARSLIATPDGRLLIARSLDGAVIISQAPLQNASDPHAWSSTTVDMGANPALAISPDGKDWCVAYWVDNLTTLVLRYSEDSGETWNAPQTVWMAETEAAGSNAEALIATDGRMHLVWTEPTQRRNWNGEAIWHAVLNPKDGSILSREVMRSLGPTSSDSPNLDSPTLTECPGGQIHIFWNNSAGTATGRFHQYSEPGGETWSKVSAVFPGLSALTSKAGLVCDSTGRLHLITAAGAPGEPGSPLHYATWYNGVWSDYATLWEGQYFGERPWMVVAGGNQLHVLWDSFRGIDQIEGRFIAHSHRIIDADATPKLLPTSEAAGTSVSTEVETQRPADQEATPETPSENPVRPVATLPTEADSVQSGLTPVVISTLPVLVLLAFAFWRSRAHQRR